MSTSEIAVQPGQVWADNDWRSRGRTVRVARVEGRYAYVEVLTDRDTAIRTTVGSTIRIMLSRFRPNSTGYRLLSSASGDTSAVSS